MKKCSYCGRENQDAALNCIECGTEFGTEPAIPAPTGPPSDIQFSEHPGEVSGEELVTLLTCGSLGVADLVVSRLQAANIQAYIPDESTVQWMGGNFNTYGVVRVQVAAKDFANAKDLITFPV